MKVRIILFPFLSSLLPPLNSQHPCTTLPPKETMVASRLDEVAISWAWHSKLITSSMFSILFHGSVCALPFWPQDVLAPGTAVFSHLCLFALAASGCPLSYPVYLTNPVHSSRSSWNVACLICLSALFPHSLSPHLSHTWPLNDRHTTLCYSKCPHSPTVATLCSKDDAFIVYVVLASDI